MKDGGITTGKLATSTGAGDGVTTAKIATAAVTAAKIGTNAVTTVKILDANVTTAKILDANVTTAKIADANVTKAKIENLTDYTVLGNVSGGAAAPAEVTILDEDTLVTDSATALATQQSIKAYVDNSAAVFAPSTYAGEESVTLPNGLIMKFGKVTGTAEVTISYGTPFPNGVLSIVITNIDSGSGASAGSANPHVKTGYTTSQFDCYINESADGGTFWQAIGY